MTKAFSYLYEGTIWKIDIHELSGMLAIEWRDQDGLPYFSVIHYRSGRLLSDHIHYGDRWWTLAAVNANQLFLQHYPQPNQGQTQGLVAIDIHSKQVTWEQFNLQFVELTQEGIAVKQRFSDTNAVSLLEPLAGSILENHTLLNKLSPLPRNIRSASPVHRTPPLPITSTLVGPYFFLETDGKELWAYHERKEDKLQLILTVIQEHNVQFKECIVDRLDHLLPEVFFMVGQQLFFVTNNKREIVSYFV